MITLRISIFVSRLIVSVILLLVASATAQTYCVRAGASGANNGSDWANAFTTLPSVLQRGATYYVAAGNYGSYTFDDAVSGTAKITIKRATAADHGPNGGWQNAYGVGVAVWTAWSITRGYYVFDGQIRNSDWRSGYGFKVGPPATGHTINLSVGGASTARDVVFRFIEVEGVGLDNTSHTDGIYAPWQTHNVTIQNSYLHDFGRCPLLFGGNTNLLIEYSLIARNSSDAAYHGAGLATQATSDVVIRHNIWEDIEGTAYIDVLNRSSSPDTNSNWEIYGNVFMYSEGNPYNRDGLGGDGAIAVINQQIAHNWKIHNNTFINLNYGLASRVSIGINGQPNNQNIKIYNNFWWRSKPATHILNNCTGCESTHNRYDQTTSSPEANKETYATASTAAFVNYAGKDFRPASGTQPGLGLAAPYDMDMDGKVRGGDGVWDRGAFEFGSAAVPAPPANLRLMTE